jgi:hypothetical protein
MSHGLWRWELLNDSADVLCDDVGTGAKKEHFREEYVPRRSKDPPSKPPALVSEPSPQFPPPMFAGGDIGRCDHRFEIDVTVGRTWCGDGSA